MIPRSFGRVPRSVQSRTLSTSISRTTAPCQPEAPKHQRRPSSSKASCPPGDERAAEHTASGSAKSPGSKDASTNIEDGKKPSARLSRRKSKDTATDKSAIKPRDEAFMTLPSVPSTSHLQLADVHTSSFFSLHRPISITKPVPPHSTNKEFNRIFEPRSTSQHKTKDIIYTIANPFPALDADHQSRDEKDLRWEIIQNSSSNAEGSRQNKVPSQSQQGMQRQRQPEQHQPQPPQSLEDLIQQFRPFNVPPAPVPFEDEPLLQTAAEDQPVEHQSVSTQETTSGSTEQEQEPYPSSPMPTRSARQVRRALALNRRPTHRSIAKKTASATSILSPEISAEGVSEPSSVDLPPGSSKQSITDPTPNTEVKHAISVKRQRKLKMKKHKYKKLMRRTRNLRRREGRT